MQHCSPVYSMRGGVILCVASAGLTTVAIATGPALSGLKVLYAMVDIRI